MIYYVEKDNKIVLYNTIRQNVENALKHYPQYSDLEIKEIDRPIIDFQFADTEEYKREQEQKERERLDNLSLTRGDVFEALILAKGLGKAQIRAMIEKSELDEVTKALYLNRFDEALNFYRSYPIFNMLGKALGITPTQLDKFFDTATVEETKTDAYKYLTNVTFTINTVPEEATVTINETQGKSLTIPYGTDIEYSVSADGYLPQSGTIEHLTEDKAITVELVKEPDIDTDTDVSDTDTDIDVTDNEQE